MKAKGAVKRPKVMTFIILISFFFPLFSSFPAESRDSRLGNLHTVSDIYSSIQSWRTGTGNICRRYDWRRRWVTWFERMWNTFTSTRLPPSALQILLYVLRLIMETRWQFMSYRERIKADSDDDDVWKKLPLVVGSVFWSVFVYQAIMKHNSDCLFFISFVNNSFHFTPILPLNPRYFSRKSAVFLADSFHPFVLHISVWCLIYLAMNARIPFIPVDDHICAHEHCIITSVSINWK